jgi:hypothetical protein
MPGSAGKERTVDQTHIRDIEFMIRHRHTDGSYAEMLPDRPHHDAPDHDPERSWGHRRIFRCATCDEAVTLVPGVEEDVEAR